MDSGVAVPTLRNGVKVTFASNDFTRAKGRLGGGSTEAVAGIWASGDRMGEDRRDFIAASRTDCTAGNIKPTSNVMMATTTINSIRVNPRAGKWVLSSGIGERFMAASHIKKND
jgi:hypothetical protein